MEGREGKGGTMELENKKIEETCPDCGQVYCSYDEQYAREHPTGCDVFVEQEFNKHVSGECPHSEDYTQTFCCPDCGQEYYWATREYSTRHPNGLDAGKEQALDGHLYGCPGVEGLKKIRRRIEDRLRKDAAAVWQVAAILKIS